VPARIIISMTRVSISNLHLKGPSFLALSIQIFVFLLVHEVLCSLHLNLKIARKPRKKEREFQPARSQLRFLSFIFCESKKIRYVDICPTPQKHGKIPYSFYIFTKASAINEQQQGKGNS
jgi:hypothetical protein